MSNYLISVTENYRVDTEQETITMIQEAKDSNQYTLAKYSSQYKERKQKGEVVDAYWKRRKTRRRGYRCLLESFFNKSI